MPKDVTIREHFNTYRFAEHKGRVTDLLARMSRINIGTIWITGKIPDKTL